MKRDRNIRMIEREGEVEKENKGDEKYKNMNIEIKFEGERYR